MASHRITTHTDIRPEGELAGYLYDLAAQLRGPRRIREAILNELRDGLDHAIEDHIAAGLPPDQATTAAITQFGTPHAVADAFGGELATAYARRTIVWFIATGPLVGIWWLLLLHPSPWRTGLIALLGAIPVIPLIVVAIATAGGTLATTGAPDAVAARNWPPLGAGRHYRHRHAVHGRRPHHDHHVDDLGHADTAARGHRRRRQSHPHRMQHHHGATHQGWEVGDSHVR